MERLDEIYTTIKDFENYTVSNYGDVINKKTGRILKSGINPNGYYYVNLFKNGIGKNCRIHQLVANHFLENPENKKCIDHIDNNRLNNYEKNLRYASYQENNRNAKLSTRNTSGIKGVCYYKNYNKWIAQIKINNKYINLGYFKTIEEATDARQKAATKYFGEFKNACENMN